MKKLVLVVASAAFLGGLAAAVPASAQSANDWNRYQEATDPGYDLYRVRSGGYQYGYQSFSPYGYPYFDNETSGGRTKKVKNPKDRYQYCRATGYGPSGWVPFGTPCPTFASASRQTASASSAQSVSGETTNYVVDGCVVSITTDADGRKSATTMCR